MTVWHNIDKYFNNNRYDYFVGAVPCHEISSAEIKLNTNFSQAYKKFIALYGGAMINGDLLHGLRYQSDMSINSWSVIDKTLFYKETQKWPGIEDWYIVSDDGRGNPIGCKPDGSVWLSDHDTGFEHVKLADDFEQFLEKLLTDTLYDNEIEERA